MSDVTATPPATEAPAVTETPEAPQSEAPVTEAPVPTNGAIPEPKGKGGYSPSEVATILGLKGPQTIYRWVKQGNIEPALHINKLIAFSREQIPELRDLYARNQRRGHGGEVKHNAFSKAFLDWRVVERDLSQSAMADAYKVTVAQIGRWERGTSLPNAEVAEALLAEKPDLATPYIEAKAEFAREAKIKREKKKAEAEATAPSDPADAALAAVEQEQAQSAPVA
jgi:transcriptional regulator with XRE-family HTH domain